MIGFRNSVKTRLMVLITVLISGIIILFFQGITALHSIENAAGVMGDGKDIVADILPPPLYLIEAQLVVGELLQSPASQHAAHVETLRQLRKNYDERNRYWQQKSSEIDQQVIRSLFGKEKEKADAYWALLEEKFIPAIMSGDQSLAKASFDTLKTLYAEHRAGVDETVTLANTWANARNAELGSTVKSANSVFTIVAVVSVVLGALIASFTLRTIITPLTELEHSIRRVEQTLDFTVQARVHGHDEVGNATLSFNKLLNTIHSGFERIQERVTLVSDAALGLSSAAGQLARSSAQQSESTSAVAATIEEVTASIHQIADSAGDAEKASQISGNLSREGGTVIRNAAGEMAHIAEMIQNISGSIEALSSQSVQISQVTQVIKEVADQTSLLALNAAIEAARAGEQGRGFAVVADEVRKLAERTTRATEEISTIIKAVESSAEVAVTAMAGSVTQAREGMVLAEQAGHAIQAIEGGAEEVVGLVNQISSALSEQSTASHEMAKHVEKVALMTEENSTAAVNISGAATELEELARQMQAVVRQFKI